MKGLLSKLWEGFKRLANIWGRVVNTILLSVVYFTVFGLMALGARLLGQDLLGTRPRSKAESLWLDWENKEVSFENCRRQF